MALPHTGNRSQTISDRLLRADHLSLRCIPKPNIITSGITVQNLQKIIENKLNNILWNGFNFISLLLLITNTKKMKVTLNSNLFPIIRVGMYNSNISSDEIFDDYTIVDDKENGYIHYDVDYFWSNFQNDKYVKRIQELSGEYLNGKLDNGNGIEITIKCKEIYSPKFYNFGTDEIVLDVTYDKTKILKVVKTERDGFNQFLKDNYSSYDGFTSFTSNNYNDWLVDFEENETRSIGAVLTYLFKESITYNRLQFEIFVKEGVGYYSEYVDSTDYENEVVILKKYVKDNYIDVNLDSIDFDQFGFEILDNESCVSIFKEVMNEIESNTMSMF